MRQLSSAFRDGALFVSGPRRSGITERAFLLLVVLITLADAPGGSSAILVHPPDDRDPAGTFIPHDPLLTRPRSSARINLHPARTELNGGLGKSRRAAQQHQRDQDTILHRFDLQPSARLPIRAPAFGSIKSSCLVQGRSGTMRGYSAFVEVRRCAKNL